MANRNSNASLQRDATPAASQGSYHTYDNWLLPEAEHNTDSLFASTVLDISRGAKVIASIVCAHVTDLNAIAGGAGNSVRTLLSEQDTEALARLAVFSLGELYRMAVDQVDALNSKAARWSASMKRDSTLDPCAVNALGYFNADAAIEQPNGTFLVGADCAQDHATMRADQLSALLLLLRLDDARSFRNISNDRQLSLMWLASQLADELAAMLPIVAAEACRAARETCGGSQ